MSVNSYKLIENTGIDQKLFEILVSCRRSAFLNKDVIKGYSEIKNFSRGVYYHCIDVAFLSLMLGVCCYSNIEDLTFLFAAAILHDYGKIYVSKAVLDKPSILSIEERREIEKHAYAGYQHLKEKTRLDEKVLLGILDHHERMDGSGYHHKKSAEISDFAKIIAIADVYDAMASDRVYRKKVPRESLFSYLYKSAGKHFDSRLVYLFLNQILKLTESNDLDDMLEQYRSGFMAIDYQPLRNHQVSKPIGIEYITATVL